MPDNAQTICDNAKFVGITKMAINVKLFNIGICDGMGRHGAVSRLVRVIAVIKMHGFCICFELFDDTVGILGIIFCNPGFYAGGIEDGHRSADRINCLADWFSKVDQAVKKDLQVFRKILLEPGDLRSIRNLVETTEFTEMPGILKENKEEGICRDRKNPLKDKRP